MIDIYCLDINNKSPKISFPKSITTHINNYKNQKYKKISKLTWSTLIDLLLTKYKVDLNKDEICFEKNGKPYLKSNKLFFSLSNSSNLIAIAISNKPIGLDIQEMIDLNLHESITERILNKKQLKQYQNSKNKAFFLTKIWAQKESFIKLKGLTILDITQIINVKPQGHTCEVIDSNHKKYILSYSI